MSKERGPGDSDDNNVIDRNATQTLHLISAKNALRFHLSVN